MEQFIFAQRVSAVANCYLTGETLHFKEMLKEFVSMQTEKGNIINKKAPELSVDFYDMFALTLATKDYMGLCGDEQLSENICEKLILMFKWISKYESDGILKNVPARFDSEALLNACYIYALDTMSEFVLFAEFVREQSFMKVKCQN